MINQTDLKYFVELATTLHVSRSAERLGVTQPTLSHCLKRLEEETGSELFIRSKKGISLTAAGQRLFGQAQELIHKWDQVLQSVKDEVDQISGVIRLGSHSAVAQYTLPQVLPQFLKKNPEINFILHHGLSRHLTESVVSSLIDVAFVVNPVSHPDLIIKEVAKDRVVVWKSKNCVNGDILILDPVLMQTQDIIGKLAKKGIRFKRVIESSSLEVISQLVSEDVGCGILPERVMKAFSQKDVHPIKDSPELHDRVCLIYKREFRKLKRGQAFIEHVSSVFN